MDLDGVEGVIVGLKEEDRWITFAVGAEYLSTEELVDACRFVARPERSAPPEGSDVKPQHALPIEGVRLRDPEGRTIGALIAVGAQGTEIDPATGRVMAELATLIAPLAVSPRAGEEAFNEQHTSADPALLVRVVGKIQPLISEITGFSDVLQ